MLILQIRAGLLDRSVLGDGDFGTAPGRFTDDSAIFLVFLSSEDLVNVVKQLLKLLALLLC